jgi:undecaprenyl diphosphate synthase
MDLFVWYADKELKRLATEDIRIVFLGSRDKLPEKVLVAMDRAEARTKEAKSMTLGLCLSYGGRQELTDAVRHMVAAGEAVENISPELIDRYLYHPEIPPVDLVIRTSGEQRISNFMLWRIAYAELYFIPKAWPDFGANDFVEALAEYANRHRRIGK